MHNRMIDWLKCELERVKVSPPPTHSDISQTVQTQGKTHKETCATPTPHCHHKRSSPRRPASREPAIISAPTPPAPPRPRDAPGAEDDAPYAPLSRPVEHPVFVPAPAAFHSSDSAMPSRASVPTAATAASITSSLSSASPSFSPSKSVVGAASGGSNGAPSNAPTEFNPLAALQTVVAGEMAPIKQRSKAAQQLEAYFKALPSTANLYLSYEPYLAVLVDIATAPIKATKEVQEHVLLMVKALASHSPHKFAEWISQRLHAHPGQEAWFVDWSCGLLIETELRIPSAEHGDDIDRKNRSYRLWKEKTMEFLELDAALFRVLNTWRMLLDHTGDSSVVSQIVKSLQHLFSRDSCDGPQQWRSILLKKLQPHFVDIADVLIGWAMNASPKSPMREDIVSLLEEMRPLWTDNSVFSTQLLRSFANDILMLAAPGAPLTSDGSARLDTLTVCFMMVARCVPDLALATAEEGASVLAKVLQCAVSSRHPAYSVFCISKSVEYLISICSADPAKFSPLLVLAVRFFVIQAAVLSKNHDSELGGIALIIGKTIQLTEDGFVGMQNGSSAKTDAVGLLADTMSVLRDEESDPSRDVKIIESLLAFTYFHATKLLTRLCILLARIGGADALKILAQDALEGGGKTTDERRKYQLFCAACFIVATRNAKSALVLSDEDAVRDVLRTLVASFAPDTPSNDQRWYSRLLLKISRACLCYFNLGIYADLEIASLTEDLVVGMLRSATEDLPAADAIGLVPYPAVVDSLGLIGFLVSRISPHSTIPPRLLFQMISKMKVFVGVSSAKVRGQCAQILRALASRCGVSPMGPLIFELSMDLALDPDQFIANSTIFEVLPEVASAMLVSRDPSNRPRHIPQPDCSKFSMSDFENVMEYLSKKETEWHRVCLVVKSKLNGYGEATFQSSSTTSTLMLDIVRQAAAWCVQNRLRTHFGGPAQTFSSIERLLMMYATADAESGQAYHKPTVPDEALASSVKRNTPQNPQAITDGDVAKKLMALEFVSALEVYIANATFSKSGDQSSPDSEPYKTLLFFRTNRKVCEDWLSRIRPLLLEISSGGLCPELSRHHAYAIVSGLVRKLNRSLMSSHPQALTEDLLKEIQHSEKELDSALFSLCRSYCETKDIDSIAGFGVWRESLSSALTSRLHDGQGYSCGGEVYWALPMFPWLKATSLEAEMRYEDAASEYATILSGLFSPTSSTEEGCRKSARDIFEAPIKHLRMSAQSLLGCIKQCAACYAAVRDWTRLRAFMLNFLNLASSLGENSGAAEGLRNVLDCYDHWKSELHLVSVLEALDAESLVAPSARNGWVSEPGVGVNNASLQKWGILDGFDRELAESNGMERSERQLHAHLREQLVHLSLQPDSFDPSAGESIGKNAERVLLHLDLLKISDQKQSTSRGIECVIQEHNGMVKLDHATHDSGSWANTFYGLKSACLSQGGDIDAFQKESSCRYLLQIASLARKQRNFVFAERLLEEADALVCSETNRESLLFEKSQLLTSVGSRGEGIHLLQILCDKTVESVSSGGIAIVADIHLQSLLRLASACDQVQNSSTTSFPGLLPRESLTKANFLDQQEVISTLDQAVKLKGRYLFIATKVGPNSSEAWLQFSNWCYDQSKLEMDRIIKQNGYIDLNPEEESDLVAQLERLHFGKGDRDAVVRGFLHLMENGVIISQRYDIFRQLCLHRSQASVEKQAIDQLVLLQKRCHSRVLRFHKLAAEGYGKYLSTLASNPAPSTSRGQTVTVALRVLRLLTRFGVEQEVVDALEDIFASGPIVPWCQVVPQLLSRAADPIPAVSSLICLVLKRLARHSPHLVVYPAVVDSLASNARRAVAAEIGSHSKLDDVLAELNTQSIGLVSGVHLLVSELQRVSILWDEAWISTLSKLSADVARRASTLEKEAARVEKNLSLSSQEKTDLARRKFVAIMKPILVSIERLWEETCGNASAKNSLTPHERLFLHEHGGSITEAVKRLRDMCNFDAQFDASVGLPGPNFIWNPFAEILKSLVNTSGRRDSLPLQEISPAMASMSKKRFHINMPGVVSYNSSGAFDPVSVQAIHSAITVLRTKTKPKCLEFIGSDGQSYKYLLKAREDLRLDERIMQFLKTMNGFLRTDSVALSRNLSAQHYSVIPLSHDSGLIQMVPDVTPMFQVFTNWSEPSPSSRNLPVSPPSKLLAGSTPLPQQQPPTAAFYAKLKQYGITDVSPNQRSQWPASVLKQVYQDLVAQRPRNVLRQEIMQGSGDLRESWSKTARLSKSLAVMSVLGYIVGLGDRHLDNILLCTKSGEVVHIDYNVCFDKGQKLKVPEVVPFRLTPMLQDALGLTGVEGKFRSAFEATLRIVRADDSRESLLTLLEAFVYDPLVDWTVEDKGRGGSEDLKTRLEVNVNLSLFLSRAEERRHDATAFEHQLDTIVSEFSQKLDAVTGQLSEVLCESVELDKFEKHEEKLSSELVFLEEKLSECLSHQAKQLSDFECAKSAFEVMKSKLIGFANQCVSRHRQIEKWGQRSVRFPTAHEYASVVAPPLQASFSLLHERLRGMASSTPALVLPRELLSSLHSKSQLVDASVAHLRYSLEAVLNGLRPYLVSYSHIRKEIDEFVVSETGTSENNVYFLWWKRCTEYLTLIEADAIAAAKDFIPSLASEPSTLVPPQEKIDESARMVHNLGKLEQLLSVPPDLDNDLSSIQSQFDQLLQSLFTTLSAIKLSNAQSQRILRLGGASWVVSTICWLRASGFEEESAHPGSKVPILTENALFRSLLGAAKASCMLLDLVMTPKGAIKKVRSADFLHSAGSGQQLKESSSSTAKALTRYTSVLDALQRVVVAVYDNLLLDLHGMQGNRDASKRCTMLLWEMLRSAESLGEVLLVVSGSAQASCVEQPVGEALEESPAVRNVLGAITSLFEQFSLLDESHPSVRALSESAQSGWIHLALTLCSLLTDAELDFQSANEKAIALLASHTSRFLRDHLVEPLGQIVSDIISQEWKFGFDSAAEKSRLLETWHAFVADQIPNIFPSTLMQDEDPQGYFNSVQTNVADLVNMCGSYCGKMWGRSESERWRLSISDLHRYHRCRLWYSFWFAGQVPTPEYADQMTQSQLLASLSSFAAELSRLSADQVVLESLVLELAQQMEYIASQVSLSNTEENVHEEIQACYSQVSSVFEYVRDLADLVQGISVIETSTREIGSQMVQLEVDAIGRKTLQETLETAQYFNTLSVQACEKSAVAQSLKDELEQKRSSLHATTEAKEAQQRKVHQLCKEREGEITTAAVGIIEKAKSMVIVLKAFDKFKTSTRDKAIGQGEELHSSSIVEASAPKPRHTRRSSAANAKGSAEASQNSTSNFSFMENERLVKILLRNIKSAEHLKTLESVLAKHETNSATLHGIVTSIDHALRQFISDSQPVLTHDPADTASATLGLPTSFLAITQRSASTNAPPSSLASESGLGSTNSPSTSARSTPLVPRSYQILRALMAMTESLAIESDSDDHVESDDIFKMANKLVKACFKLFFEATDMADRLSSLEKGQTGDSSDDNELSLGVHGEEEDFNVTVDVDVATSGTGNDPALTAESDDEGNRAEQNGSIPGAYVQERNRHGVQVLKRVEEKLFGHVSDHGNIRTLTVEQQASWLIEEATKVDNLCVMYEGWTPWI